jgi:hypothetical protein
MAMGLTEIDLDALRRAIKWGRRYQRNGPQIVVVPQPFPPEGTPEWIETVTRLATLAQSVTLGLRPWQCEPCRTSDDGHIDPDCYGRRPDEIALRRKLISLGLSIFEPDPMAALARAERAAAG